LSRLAFRTGAFAPVLRRPDAHKCLAMALVRSQSGSSSSVTPAEESSVEKMVHNWDNANKLYFGPERDTKNFPIPKMPDANPPVRLGFIPDSWFQFFYEKTGVTGPYVFGAGLITFLLSKEIWVVEHSFTEFVGFWIAMGIIVKKYGHKIGAALDKSGDEYNEKYWNVPLKEAKASAQEVIDSTKKDIWRQEGQSMLFDAKKENVDLQLEAIYRQRLAEVHSAVKKKLDYQMDLENASRRFEQKHMANWIVSNVVKSITPQQEKESIKKCLTDLKAIAARQATASA